MINPSPPKPAGHSYTDDFLIVADDRASCLSALETLVLLLQSLGFTVAADKTEGPTQDIVFLGIRLESNVDNNGHMRASVP